MPQTATIKSLPEAFEIVKAMQTDGLDWGEGYRPRRALAEMDDGRGCRSVARQPRQRRRARSPQRRLPPQSAERAWRHRAEGAAHPPLLPRLRDQELRPARSGDRPRDPGRLCVGAVHPQGRRGLAVAARPPGCADNRQPGCQDPGRGGPGFPSPPVWLQGPDVRWRGAQPQDRRRRPQAPCAGSPRPASRRQEGDRRLPPGESRERRRMGALPRRPLRSRPDRRRPGDDLRRRRPGLAGSSAHRVPRHPGPALPGAQDVSSTRFARPIRTPSSRIFTLS